MPPAAAILALKGSVRKPPALGLGARQGRGRHRLADQTLKPQLRWS